MICMVCMIAPKDGFLQTMHSRKIMQIMHFMPSAPLPTRKTPEVHTSGVSFARSRHLPIFTGRVQPTIFGTSELNFCVRNGNRWGLTVIDTGRPEYVNQLALLFSRTSLVFCFRRTCLQN